MTSVGPARRRRALPRVSSWLGSRSGAPGSGSTSPERLDFRVEVRRHSAESGELVVTALRRGRAVTAAAAFAGEWERPSSAYSLVAALSAGRLEGRRTIVPPERAGDVLLELAARGALVEGSQRRLSLSPVRLTPVIELSRGRSGDLSCRVVFEREGGRERVSLREGIWVTGAASAHYDVSSALVTRAGAVPPALLGRLLEQSEAHCPASGVVAFFTLELPRLAGALGVEIPAVDQVADVLDFDPVFRLEATGSLDEVRAVVVVRYGDLEKPLSSSGDFQPLLARWTESRRRATVAVADMGVERDATIFLHSSGLRGSEEPGHFWATGAVAARFWSSTLGELPDDWELYVPEELLGVRLRNEPAWLSVRVTHPATLGDRQLDVRFEWLSEGTAAEPGAVADARREGLGHVRLVDGSFAPLPGEGLDSMLQVEAALTRMTAAARGGALSAHYAGAVREAIEALPNVRVSSSARDLFERLSRVSRLSEAKSPRALAVELRPYQRQGLAWLDFVGSIGAGAILADDMGLGKTVQTLALLLAVKARRRSISALIVAPTSVAPNWAREIERLTRGLSVVVWHGSDRRSLERHARTTNVIVTSYSLMRRDAEFFSTIDFDYVILDEAQAIKNPASATAQAAKDLKGARRLALTGTPIENRLTEIWSIFDFVAPGVLPSLGEFEEAYARPIDEGGAEGEEAARRLRAVIHPFVLRRTKAEVLSELPEKIESDEIIDLGSRQRAFYAQVLAEVRETVLGEVDRLGISRSRIHVLAGLTRLRQAACDARLLSGVDEGGWSHADSAKVMAFRQRIASCRQSGHRVLVFSQFVSMLSILKAVLDEDRVRYEYLDGSTVDRQKPVERFQTDESISVFLISLKAGGSGLNLTGASAVIHFDPWWNPAVEDQASDRAHRYGQKNVVSVYRFVAAGTIEDKILALKEKKRELAQAVLTEDAARAESLSRRDLEDLFS